MKSKLNITPPRYQQIAANIAAKIVNGDYKVGDKLYARSSLATQYGVSSETARRAITVLSDLNIVKSTKGSGVLIISYEEAARFVRQFEDVKTISDLRQDIMDSVERQKKETEYLYETLNHLISQTERFHNLNAFAPFKIEISTETPFLNKTVSDLNFWHHTAATIIGIRRGDTILLSPGPYAVLEEGDIYYFVGDQNCLGRVRAFLYPEN